MGVRARRARENMLMGPLKFFVDIFMVPLSIAKISLCFQSLLTVIVWIDNLKELKRLRCT